MSTYITSMLTKAIAVVCESNVSYISDVDDHDDNDDDNVAEVTQSSVYQEITVPVYLSLSLMFQLKNNKHI